MVSVSAAPSIARSKPATLDSGRLTAALVALFVCSGACALIYQVLWVRILSLAFGVTIYAVTVVLASFMAGLGLGSLLGGRLAERLRRPLLVYGLVEIGIGLVALATPAAFQGVQQLYAALAQSFESSPALLSAARLALSFALLIVPTGLMGATLPIVVRSSLARRHELAGRIGLLYTSNTAGAIAGAFVAGFWLIGGLGIGASIQLAAALNGLVGLSAILLQRLTSAAELSPRLAETADRGAAYSETSRQLALAAYGLAGVCSFAYEVVWTRMLSLVLDTSIYAFVTMLSMVLVGIAVGSAVATPLLSRRWSWPLIFGLLEVGVAFGALWAIGAVKLLPTLKGWLLATPGLSRLATSSIAFNFVVASLAILPSTLLIGATFPIAARIYTAGAARPSERLGQIYSANVFGAIAGSLLGGFVLLPLLGTQASLLAISLASLALGAVLLLGAGRAAPSIRVGLAGGSLLLFALLWNAKPDLYRALFRARFPGAEVTWFEEGLETTVSVVKTANGVKTLFTNSRGQANDEPGLVNYHRQIAHLPLLVRPRASDVLIIGLGSGGTAGSILQHDGTRVDVVELSDAILGGAAEFRHTNYDVLRDPGMRLEIGDGRNYLLTTRKRYDLITNDTIQPFDAGATNLYSAEYYRLAMSALKPGGVVAQWIAPSKDYQYRLMLRTFLSVFPHVTLWLSGDLVIGSREPITLDLPAIARRFQSPKAVEAMRAVGFDEPASATLWFVADRPEIEAYVGPGPILTDDRPVIEYFRSLPGGGQDAPPDLYNPYFSRNPDKIIVTR